MSKQEGKSSMSPEERARRRARVGKAASEKNSKSEQLNFRIEEQSIRELQDMAFQKGLPVGSMIREWVLERLCQEKLGYPASASKALKVLEEVHDKLNGLFHLSDAERAPGNNPIVYPLSVQERSPSSSISADWANETSGEHAQQASLPSSANQVSQLIVLELLLKDGLNVVQHVREVAERDSNAPSKT